MKSELPCEVPFELRTSLSDAVGLSGNARMFLASKRLRTATIRVDDRTQTYAVKLHMNRRDVKGWRHRLERGVSVQASAADFGVPAPRPHLLADKELVAELPSSPFWLVTCEEWVEGRAVTRLSHMECVHVSGALVSLTELGHDLSLEPDTVCDDVSIPPFAVLQHLPGLPSETGHFERTWNQVFAVPDTTTPILAHRDLQPQNVLRSSSGLAIVDWENAGFTGVGSEIGRLIGLWSGRAEQRTGLRLAKALLSTGLCTSTPGIQWFGEWLAGFARFLLHLQDSGDSAEHLAVQSTLFWNALESLPKWTEALAAIELPATRPPSSCELFRH